MILLENDQLIINIIEPDKEYHLLSSRYCHGGYIWQVEDKRLGPVFSGPSYPQNPDPFDGQGAPEAFETAPGYFPSQSGDTVLVVGVGEVIKTSSRELFHPRWNSVIKKRSDWEIKTSGSFLQMICSQRFKGYGLVITRDIILDNRSVHSSTTITNSGDNPLPIRWFAHPFFPHNKDMSCCILSCPVTIPENPGFFLKNNQIFMKKEYDWEKGCYRALGIPWGSSLFADFSHPFLERILLKCSFNPVWLPIWANTHTFSLEPFFSKVITPGSTEKWSICYQF